MTASLLRPEALSVVGGSDTWYGGLFLYRVTPDCPELSVGDRILAFGGAGMINATVSSFIKQQQALQGSRCSLVVQRVGQTDWMKIKMHQDELAQQDGMPQPPGTYIRPLLLRPYLDGTPAAQGRIDVVQLKKSAGNGKLGMKLTGGYDTDLKGIFVSGITSDGAVAADGRIQVGFVLVWKNVSVPLLCLCLCVLCYSLWKRVFLFVFGVVRKGFCIRSVCVCVCVCVYVREMRRSFRNSLYVCTISASAFFASFSAAQTPPLNLFLSLTSLSRSERKSSKPTATLF